MFTGTSALMERDNKRQKGTRRDKKQQPRVSSLKK